MYEFYMAVGHSWRRQHEACDAWYRGPDCESHAHGRALRVHGRRRRAGRPGHGRGRHRPDHLRHRQGQLQLAPGRDRRLEPAPSGPEGDPAAAARGGERPAGPAGREPPGQERPVRRHRHGCHLDCRVRLERLDHPAAAGPVPARRIPQACRRHRHVPGPALRGTRLQQRGPAVLPQGHPGQGGRAAAQDLGPAAAARHHAGAQARLYGYAGTFAPDEGLTVNFASAVQSAGGSILSPEGTRVTVNSAPALRGLEFLVHGFKQGWIPQVALTYEEESAQDAFAAGKFLFLANWPDVYAALSAPGPQNKVYGKFGVAALPGPDGMGSSSLGGANLAISSYSQHQRTALDFITYMTDLPNERQMLEQGSFPPVWTRLYTDQSLI